MIDGLTHASIPCVSFLFGRLRVHTPSHKGELDEELFNDFMTDLLQNQAENIYRAKGLLAIHGRKDKYILQAVHETIDLGQASIAWKEDEKKVSKFVFIGRNLKADDLRKSFKACKWKALPAGWFATLDERLGKTYYYHAETRKTQWERPSESGGAEKAGQEEMAA